MAEEQMIDSTSDERTVKEVVDWFKEAGAEFILRANQVKNIKPEAGREFSLAITHMEDAVMRAVRGVTA